MDMYCGIDLIPYVEIAAFQFDNRNFDSLLLVDATDRAESGQNLFADFRFILSVGRLDEI